jgi:hypothetical protein
VEVGALVVRTTGAHAHLVPEDDEEGRLALSPTERRGTGRKVEGRWARAGLVRGEEEKARREGAWIDRIWFILF